MACITKRGGRYVIDCYDQTGKRYRKTMPEGTTKKAARERLGEIEKSINRGVFIHDKKVPIFSELTRQWLEHKKPNIRATTHEIDESIIKNHFGGFNALKVSMITTPMVEKFFSGLLTGGKKIGTIKRISSTLNQILAYAVRHRMIDSNPVRDAERPKKTMNSQRTVTVLNPEQIRALLDHTPNPETHALFMLAIMTGARQGELLGLKWPDVDFEKKQLHVQRTYNHNRFFLPKTSGSIRKIDLAPAVILELRKWKLASRPTELDLIFTQRNNKPLNGPSQNEKLHNAVKKAGLPIIHFHELRHTYASLLISMGENIKYIQTQLGHSTPMMTLNVYSHLMKSENQEAAVRLEKAIFG